MADFIPYAKLSDEQKELVNSDERITRMYAASLGLGLDKLIEDSSDIVRKEVAYQGYGCDVMVHDPEWCVRSAVAAQGYGLDKLIEDPDLHVRANVGRYLSAHDMTFATWIVENPDKCAIPENIYIGKTKGQLAQYQAAMVDICRTLGAEPNVGNGDPYYYQEIIENSIEEIKQPSSDVSISLKNPVVLKQVGEDALIFTGEHQVEPYCIAYSFDNETRSWAFGTYYTSLLDATMDFEKQYGTLAYAYTLDHEDITPVLDAQGFEPSASNVCTLMRETDELSSMTDYINENLANMNWICDEIDNAASILYRKDPAFAQNQPTLKETCEQAKHASAALNNQSNNQPAKAQEAR